MAIAMNVEIEMGSKQNFWMPLSQAGVVLEFSFAVHKFLHSSGVHGVIQSFRIYGLYISFSSLCFRFSKLCIIRENCYRLIEGIYLSRHCRSPECKKISHERKKSTRGRIAYRQNAARKRRRLKCQTHGRIKKNVELKLRKSYKKK